MTSWVQTGDFTLSGGRQSSFKLECDDLTDDEIASMCALLAKIVRPFGAVLGVPRGGIRVADALAPYVTEGPTLIVDDVWTTGRSIMAYRSGVTGPTRLAVLFTRGPIPPTVTALFILNPQLWAE